MSAKNDSQQEMKADQGFTHNALDFQDRNDRCMREKFSALEENSRRPLRQYNRCEHELFAYMLCSHNRSMKYAHFQCKEEYDDYAECFRSTKRNQRASTLRVASAKAGDIVPGLYTSWRY